MIKFFSKTINFPTLNLLENGLKAILMIKEGCRIKPNQAYNPLNCLQKI